MGRVREDDISRLDDAARAGWLYYVAGNTQEEIATKLAISRQAAQRLVSLSVSAGLVKVRIDHPIAACLALAADLRAKFGMRLVEVVPSDCASNSTTLGIAEACAAEMERRLKTTDPLTVGLGTGRTLKAAVETLPAMVCRQHRIVSLTGSVAPDGSASIYNVIFSMADRVQAPHYPMPLPVVVTTREERALLHEQKVVQKTLLLASAADVAFVGVGELTGAAPLVADTFMTAEEREDLVAAGGVAEIVGWVFDSAGRILQSDFNDRVASAPIPPTSRCEVVAVAMGEAKAAGIAAAAKGGLINGLITDETTALRLLSA